MDTTLHSPVRLGLYLIAAFYLFGALVLIIGTVTGLVGAEEAIARAHGLPGLAGEWLVFLVALLALLLGYGLISRSRWGYIITITYSLYLIVVSLASGALNFPLHGTEEAQIYFGNFLWSMLVVVYLFLRRRHFLVRD